MANPSLQIGNSNWAIKEDNLLGYSTAGTRFVPQPITMTRASAGTRVNSSGLVETVELLGSELVVNGDFATDSNWTNSSGTNWSISGGKASVTSSASILYYQQSGVLTTPTVGKSFLVTWTISDLTQGGIGINVGGYLNTTIQTSNGTYQELITPTNANTNTLVYLQASPNTIGSILNISVKESTKNNLARVDYDGTASSLLVEPQRTNLIPYSEDFSQGSWQKLSYGTASSPVVTSNQTISPNGNLSADKVFFDRGSGTSASDESRLYFSSGSAPSSMSVYLKSFDGVSTYNMQIICANTNKDITINGVWQRFDVSELNSGSNFQIRLLGNLGSDQTTTLSVWGAQLEEGSYPTSYIPTSGSTVTRVQDQYSKTGISNLINSEEGVLFVEMAALANDSTNRQFTISNGTNDYRLVLKYDNQSNVIQCFNRVNTVETAFLSHTVTDITVFNKIAIKYKLNDYALWINGVEVATDSSATTFIGLNTLTTYSGGSSFYGKVKQLQVFKTALTDTELATLTT